MKKSFLVILSAAMILGAAEVRGHPLQQTRRRHRRVRRNSGHAKETTQRKPLRLKLQFLLKR